VRVGRWQRDRGVPAVARPVATWLPQLTPSEETRTAQPRGYCDVFDAPLSRTSRLNLRVDNLARLAHRQGRLDDAEAEFRGVLAELASDHPHVLIIRNNLARVLYDQGRLGEALAEYEAVRAGQRHVLGDNNPIVLRTRHNIALVLRDKGQLDQAEIELRCVLALQQEVLGAEHPHSWIPGRISRCSITTAVV
jgi:tetratricopeptide (TPR) repeat protein